MKLIAIAAMGKNRELGYKNDMPWKHSLKKDLAFFKAQTIHQPVLMGRKTLESLQRLLPERQNLILSSTLSEEEVKENYGDQTPFQIYRSLEEFLKNDSSEKVFVIGGASLYQALLEQFDELILTEIDQSFQADVFFPDFPSEQYKKTVLNQVSENGLNYKHILYEKQQPDF